MTVNTNPARRALGSCRDAIEHRLPLIVTLGIPAVLGIAAGFATAMFADGAEPDDLDAALTALITLNAVVVGLVLRDGAASRSDPGSRSDAGNQ